MFNQGMFGMNPEQMARAQEIGNHLRVEMTNYRQQGRFEVRLVALDPSAEPQIPYMADQMCQQLAAILNAMMGVKGKIVNVE